MGKSGTVLAAGEWLMCFYVTKRKEKQKESTNIGSRMFYINSYLKRAKVLAISEISIQRTASSFNIRRIQNPVKDLR